MSPIVICEVATSGTGAPGKGSPVPPRTSRRRSRSIRNTPWPTQGWHTLVDLDEAFELEPAFGAAHRYLAGVYRLTGQVDLAVDADRMAIALGDPIGPVDLTASLAASGNREEALTMLEPIEAEVRQFQDWALNVALVYAYPGDVDEAFDWLDEAYEYRDQWRRSST